MNRSVWKQWYKSRDPAIMARLIDENQPLIQKFLRRFMQQAPSYPETLEKDLEQAAYIGFITACERWKPKKGAFSTICYYCVRHELQVIAAGATPIVYPRDVVFTRCDQVDRFFAQHGRNPDPSEMTVSRRERMHVHTADWTFINASAIDKGDPHTIEGNAPKGGARQDIPDFEGDLDERRRYAKLKEFMATLDPTQQEALLRGNKALVARAKRFFEEQ